jgi:hypothetical protein
MTTAKQTDIFGGEKDLAQMGGRVTDDDVLHDLLEWWHDGHSHWFYPWEFGNVMVYLRDYEATDANRHERKRLKAKYETIRRMGATGPASGWGSNCAKRMLVRGQVYQSADRKPYSIAPTLRLLGYVSEAEMEAMLKEENDG